MLTNPSQVIYQSFKTAMKDAPEEKQQINASGLLSPKKSARYAGNDDIMQPANRALEYVKYIQKKRQEVKDNGNS
jgi:hypothetical protein